MCDNLLMLDLELKSLILSSSLSLILRLISAKLMNQTESSRAQTFGHFNKLSLNIICSIGLSLSRVLNIQYSTNLDLFTTLNLQVSKELIHHVGVIIFETTFF